MKVNFCLFFELMRGWSGMLVEASPRYCAQAATIRSCQCLNIAVAAEEGEQDFLEIASGLTQCGGLVETLDPDLRRTIESDQRHQGKVIRVRTRTLPQILDENGLTEIDYISLDSPSKSIEAPTPERNR